MFTLLSHSGPGRTLAAAALLAAGLAGAIMPAQAEVLDARTTPASTRAPVISVDPATLPDFALFRECEACPEMVVMPGGSFEMGSPSTEKGRNVDEGPQRQVSVSRFAMSRFETTWAEWEACVAAGRCTSAGGDAGWGKGRRPVIDVDWNDARAYAGYVSGQTQGAYRLPSEAEWEYAARGGTSTRWSFGEAEGQLGNHAWFSGNSSSRTQPVGGRTANPWGLFDVHGNVWEWVEDCWAGSYLGAPTNGKAVAAPDCESRAARGGSWFNIPQGLHSANRYWYAPTDRGIMTGFRLSRTLSDLVLRPGTSEIERLATRAPGTVFRDGFTSGSGEGPEMVVLPSGNFMMGSPLDETGGFEDEGPQRSVRIGYEFAVGRYEVTWSQYSACVSAGACPAAEDDGFGQGSRPVTNVSWEDAQAYVTWLNQKTGLTGRSDRYRLLTEAEWEYAARAGSKARWSYGDDESRLGNFAWFGSGSGWRTQPVGGKTANGFGLHDLHGNAWEWVEDCYEPGYRGQPSDGSAFRKSSCSSRVYRGGAWNNSLQYLRSAVRNWGSPGFRNYDLGLRLARTLP